MGGGVRDTQPKRDRKSEANREEQRERLRRGGGGRGEEGELRRKGVWGGQTCLE